SWSAPRGVAWRPATPTSASASRPPTATRARLRCSMSERRWTAADFDYELPPELIAQVPTATRGASRLLVVERSLIPSLRDATFADLVDLIPPGDLLVLNSTKVRHAR